MHDFLRKNSSVAELEGFLRQQAYAVIVAPEVELYMARLGVINAIRKGWEAAKRKKRDIRFSKLYMPFNILINLFGEFGADHSQSHIVEHKKKHASCATKTKTVYSMLPNARMWNM